MKTRDKIILAAKEEFHKQGFGGARMQAIADASGLNKALLHYHFKSKDELFKSVLLAGVIEVFPVLIGTLNSELSIKDKIRTVVHIYIDHLSQNPDLPGFVLGELRRNPDFISDNLSGLATRPSEFFRQVEKEVEAGKIPDTDPLQLLTSLISLCVFPFIGKPMIQFVSGVNDKEFKQFINDRKAHVETLLINGLYGNSN